MNSKGDVVVVWPEEADENGIPHEKFESKIGQLPQMLVYGHDSLFGDISKCQNCGGEVGFIGQIFAPYREWFFRTIYIFVCKRPECANKKEGIHVYRCQLPKENEFYSIEVIEGVTHVTLKKDYKTPEYFEKMMLVNKEWILYDDIITPKEQKNLEEKIINDPENNPSEMDASFEDYSYMLYSQTLDDIPGQVIRYSFSPTAVPLYYSDYDQFTEKDTTLPCENCGKNRIFEFEMTNSILTYITPLIELDWGMFVVYSCPDSCAAKGPSMYVREAVLLQLSPDEIDKEKLKNKQARIMEEIERDGVGEDADQFDQENAEFEEDITQKNILNSNNIVDIEELKKNKELWGKKEDITEDGHDDEENWN